jgi:hypothetical protein
MVAVVTAEASGERMQKALRATVVGMPELER